MKNQFLQDLQYYLLKFKAEICMILFSITTFLTPILGMVVIVSFAVGLDTMAGIYIARKTKTYESHKLFNVVVKTFFYMSTILLAFLIDKFIFDEKISNIGFLISKSVTMFWIYIEAKSLDEKSVKLGNKPFHETMTSLVKKIKSFKKDINEIKNE